MRTRSNPLALAAVFAMAAACCTTSHASADREPSAIEPMIVTPPSGYPGGSLSTDNNNRERQGYLSHGSKRYVETRAEMPKAEATGLVVYPAAAPASQSHTAKTLHHWKKVAGVKNHKAKRHHRAEVIAFVPRAWPSTLHLREVEALNRLHHLNQSEIALAKMALAHSPSSSTLAMAQQTKDDHERLEKRVVATAEKLDIKLEEYSPATYEVAVTNELLANRGNFEASLVMAMSRSRAEAEHGLTVAQTETLRDRDLVELIKEEKPLLAANHVTPASYRNESVAREGEVELGQ